MAHANAHDRLTEETKAKLKGCETPEEIFELAREDGYELSDEQLEGISGGWGSSCEDVKPSRSLEPGYNVGE
jgi:hypothetical protein